MLTAKNLLEDKLNGFDNGANDYVTKPFHIDELVARVNVQLRNADLLDMAKSENKVKETFNNTGKDGENLTLDGATVDKSSGDSSNTENSEFYGVNAELYRFNMNHSFIYFI